MQFSGFPVSEFLEGLYLEARGNHHAMKGAFPQDYWIRSSGGGGEYPGGGRISLYL